MEGEFSLAARVRSVIGRAGVGAQGMNESVLREEVVERRERRQKWRRGTMPEAEGSLNPRRIYLYILYVQITVPSDQRPFYT